MKQTILTMLFVFFCFPCCSHADTFGAGPNAFDIEFVTIGDPGNPGDSPVSFLSGSVAYTYNIAKYEISFDMVNKANSATNLGITTVNGEPVWNANSPSKPAIDITWYEAARFVNWLNESTGYLPAYKFLTHPGDIDYDSQEAVSTWTATDAGFDAGNPLRNRHAKYVLPSFNERYKAAHYDPAAMAYYDYPTGSDTPPTAVASGTAPGTAVFDQPHGQGPAAVNQAGGWSLYGVMGLGGNAGEWSETTADGANADSAAHRFISGGAWYGPALSLASFNSTVVGAPDTGGFLGFRVVSLAIPEPTTALLLTTCAAVCTLHRPPSRRR